MRLILKYLKRFVLGGFVLYGYNMIAVNFNMIIPINVITVGMIAILGVPSLIALILLKLFIM